VSTIRRWIIIALLAPAAFFAGQASWLQAKATLAQWLIAAAWQQTLIHGEAQRPWPWADTWPVARLVTPDGANHYVLDSISGEALAFGPGLLPVSVAPGESGTTLIAGHQDSHFAFLNNLKPGEKIRVQNRDGQTFVYRVDAINIVDSSQQRMSLQYHTAELKLVTCYPFNSLQSGGPLRYVVTAYLDPEIHQPRM